MCCGKTCNPRCGMLACGACHMTGVRKGASSSCCAKPPRSSQAWWSRMVRAYQAARSGGWPPCRWGRPPPRQRAMASRVGKSAAWSLASRWRAQYASWAESFPFAVSRSSFTFIPVLWLWPPTFKMAVGAVRRIPNVLKSINANFERFDTAQMNDCTQNGPEVRAITWALSGADRSGRIAPSQGHAASGKVSAHE